MRPALHWTLAVVLLGMSGQALATPKLGNPVPALHLESPLPEQYLVALYSHDCGDLTGVWNEVLSLKLPVLAINAEGTPSPAPQGTVLLQGERATQFSRDLKVTTYPTVLLVEDGVVVGVWEPDGTSIPEALGLKPLQ